MRRVAADEPSAFEHLVERILPRLLGFFRRMGADHASAEDCAQEVLLKIYRARSAYQPRARFSTYLLHVARNHWIDVYRHRRLGPVTLSADATTGSSEDEPSSLAASLPARHEPRVARADAAALQAALDRALARLTTEHREVFVLAHLETLRYEEIGSLLGIPVGTVKSRVHTALKQLRGLLAREGFEP